MIDENGIKLGDYVFVSRWSDGDLNDPWYVGFLKEMGEDNRGNFYKVEEQDNMDHIYRHCIKLTKKDGEKILSFKHPGGNILVKDVIEGK